MELLKICKRALKYKGPADKYVESLIQDKLKEFNVPNSDRIIKKLEENYDDEVLVKAIQLLEEDETGNSLKSFLDVD